MCGSPGLAIALVHLLMGNNPTALFESALFAPQQIRIVVIAGDGGRNSIIRRTAANPVVQVTDENGLPAVNAEVTFTLPDSGAGADFITGARTHVAHTDEKGFAYSPGLRPNNTPGTFSIQIRATYQGLVAAAVITQTNLRELLRVLTLEGEGAVNSIRSRVSRTVVVQVVDESNAPVAGALVTFTLPPDGPGGTFASGSRSETTVTDRAGQASITLTPNTLAGKFDVRVTASYQGEAATTTVAQVNASGAGAAAQKRGTGKIIAGIAAAAAAGGIGAAVGLGGGKGTPTSPPTTVLAPGTPSVGPPR